MPFSFSTFLRDFPITSAIVALNLGIFVLNHLGIIPPIISLPRELNVYNALAHFSHIDLMHIAFNMLIFVQISPLIEQKIRGFFYLSIIIALWCLLITGGFYFSTHPSLGFSGIGLGLMTFCGLLYYQNHQFSQQILGWTAINILIGFLPGISFLMHFLGAIAGLIIFGIYWAYKKIC